VRADKLFQGVKHHITFHIFSSMLSSEAALHLQMASSLA